MKAIILAAGKGTRMGAYTAKLPKGMLEFAGKSLIERQIETLRSAGIEEIAIVTGYERDAISFPGISYFHNEHFAETNMLESLFCAKSYLEGDVLVAYADILYQEDLLSSIRSTSAEIVVSVDQEWRSYWKFRHGTVETDLETLVIEDGKIRELGQEVESSKGIDHRYVGLIKFSAGIWSRVFEFYQRKKNRSLSWRQSGKEFPQGYMTDLLNELIEEGVEVCPSITSGGWLEFDTADDYEVCSRALDNGELSQFFVLEAEAA